MTSATNTVTLLRGINLLEECPICSLELRELPENSTSTSNKTKKISSSDHKTRNVFSSIIQYLISFFHFITCNIFKQNKGTNSEEASVNLNVEYPLLAGHVANKVMHLFHQQCIDTWLANAPTAPKTTIQLRQCPSCKAPFENDLPEKPF